MVIDPNSINTSASLTAKGKAVHSETSTTGKGGKPAPESASASDSVSLSSEAKSLGKLEAAVNSSSEVDSAKVSAIKAELSSGQYQIDASAIAASILDQES